MNTESKTQAAKSKARALGVAVIEQTTATRVPKPKRKDIIKAMAIAIVTENRARRDKLNEEVAKLNEEVEKLAKELFSQGKSKVEYVTHYGGGHEIRFTSSIQVADHPELAALDKRISKLNTEEASIPRHDLQETIR